MFFTSCGRDIWKLSKFQRLKNHRKNFFVSRSISIFKSDVFLSNSERKTREILTFCHSMSKVTENGEKKIDLVVKKSF